MRAIKTFSFLLLFLLLSACGGGGGTSQTANEIAIDKIVAYANDASNPAPSVQDYIDAGVTGVNESNLADINAVVDGLEAEDVDTTAELEALTTQLNVNIVPTVNAGIDKTVQVNNSIEIIGTASDSDGTITSYEWTMGSTVLATTASFSYTPSAVGTDTLTLTVTDNDGDTASDSTDVVVTILPVPNIAPTADAGDNKTVKVNHSVSITGTGIDTDGTIDSYEWKLGSNILSTTATFSYTPTIVGTDTLILTVTDNDGATASANIDVVVVANVAPTANAGEDKKAVDGDIFNIVGIANDSDGSIAKVEWKRGSTVLATTKTYSYTTSSLVVTTDTLTFTVTDNDGATASSEMKVLIGINIPDDDRFLTFVNTGKIEANDDTGTVGDDNDASAEKYYQLIDPSSRKTTLEDWYIENCFVEPSAAYITSILPRLPPNCEGDFDNHAFAIYLNNVDLNLGRRMSMRTNSELGAANPLKDTVASCVQNYASIENTITQTDPIATVCMEYGPPDDNTGIPTSGKKFTKFYTYCGRAGIGDCAIAGDRILKVDLDERGDKYQPGMCLTCHGGDPDTDLFNRTPAEAAPNHVADVGAGFIPWDLDNFKFSTTNPLYTKAAQEEEFRKLNQGAMYTYKAFDTTGPATEGAKATRELVRGWYGPMTGDTIPETSIFQGDFIPVLWQDKERLYSEVVAPNCRACHAQQGLSNSPDIDFATSAKFLSKDSLIYTHVYEQATMPLAKRTFDLLWDNLRADNLAKILHEELKIHNDALGNFNIPGDPIIKTELIPVSVTKPFVGDNDTITLDGRKSLFANTYEWEVTGPGGTNDYTLLGVNNSNTTFKFTPTSPLGEYTIKLTITNSDLVEISDTQTVELASSRVPKNFSDILSVISTNGCTGCHINTHVFSMVGTDQAIYDEITDEISHGLSNRISPDAVNSLFLTKPTNTYEDVTDVYPDGHGGGTIFAVDSTAYNTIREWIDIDGAPGP